MGRKAMRNRRLHVRLGIQPTTPVRSAAASAVSDEESSEVSDQDDVTEESDQGDETEESDQGNESEESDQEPEEDDSAWPHRVTPVTQEQIDQANLLKYSILADSSMRSYANHLAKFVHFIADCDPDCLTPDVRAGLKSLPVKQWNRFLKDYVLTKPRPPSTMFDLDKLNYWFDLWMSSMKKRDGGSMSFSTYNSCRSAVVALLTLVGKSTESFDGNAATLLRGLKVKHATCAAHGTQSVKRGKNPLSFQSYRRIAVELLEQTNVNSVFSHTVLTTMWNLMSRVGNAVSICKTHMEWHEDSLVIYFAHEKTDQTMSKPGDPRHIYANPFIPEVCPILSLGIFFHVINITASDSPFLFAGSNQYFRFQKSLKNFLSDSELLNFSAGTFGTHSIRKGAATYVSSGSTACPSYTAVANRAGWAMGGVSSIYLQYQEAGDQYVGRTVSGLDSNKPSFGVLPPCFRDDFDAESLMRRVFTRYDDATPQFKQVLKMTTASVLYRKQWLFDHLPRNHPLFSTTLFRMLQRQEGPSGLDKCVHCDSLRTTSQIKATGIPPHIGIMMELHSTTEVLKSLPDSLLQSLTHFIEERNMSCRPVTKDDLQSVISAEFERFWQRLGEERTDDHDHHQETDDSNSAFVSASDHSLFVVDGKLTRLPPDFTLPTGNLTNAWICYLFPDKQNGTPPLRAVFGKEVPKKFGPSFSRYKQLMEAIIEQARMQNKWSEPKDTEEALSILNSLDLSTVISSQTATNRPRRRLHELCWSTLAQNYYLSHRQPKRRRVENPDP